MIAPGSRVRRIFPARDRGQTGTILALRDCQTKARVQWDPRPPVCRACTPRTEPCSTIGLYALEALAESTETGP